MTGVAVRIIGGVLCAGVMGWAGAAVSWGADLKVMSFNIRTSGADDGVNNWENRKDLVVRTINAFGPDLLGLQEALRDQRDFLRDELTDYAFVGRSVYGNGTGEFAGLMYRTDRFTRVRSGTFQLSETPDDAGSKGWDAKLPRVTTWAELQDRQTPGLSFVFMNTHWDHEGAEARFQSAVLMREMIRELAPGMAVVVTGDFNADQDGRAYDRMTGRDNQDTVRNLIDTYRVISPGDSDTVGTAHGFDGTAGDGRIDWILHDHRFSTIDADIVRTSYNKRYPSDHFPITAVIRPDPVPEPTAGAVATVGLAVAALSRRRRSTATT